MAVPFGFSVGDFIAGINLIITSVKAVQDTSGASAEYVALNEELESLKAGLSTIDELHLQQSACKQRKAIQEAVQRLQRCIETFIKKTAKYQPRLRQGTGGWKANLRKIQWALCKKVDIVKFRRQLEAHTSSINMLLITLQVTQGLENNQKQQECEQRVQKTHAATFNIQQDLVLTKDLVTGLSSQQADFIQRIMAGHRQLLQEVSALQQLLQLQLQRELPPQVPLQKPVVLLDACGRVAPFHLEFINSAEAFIAVLKVRFMQSGVTVKGLQKLDRSEFVLQDHRRDLSLNKSWETVFRPGQNVNMSMLFRRTSLEGTCPSCYNENVYQGCGTTECIHCGLQYCRIVEEADHKPVISEHDQGVTIESSHKSVDMVDAQDTLDAFRRVHVITSPDSLLERPGTESSTAALIQELEKHTKGLPITNSELLDMVELEVSSWARIRGRNLNRRLKKHTSNARTQARSSPHLSVPPGYERGEASFTPINSADFDTSNYVTLPNDVSPSAAIADLVSSKTPSHWVDSVWTTNPNFGKDYPYSKELSKSLFPNSKNLESTRTSSSNDKENIKPTSIQYHFSSRERAYEAARSHRARLSSDRETTSPRMVSIPARSKRQVDRSQGSPTRRSSTDRRPHSHKTYAKPAVVLGAPPSTTYVTDFNNDSLIWPGYRK